MRCSFDRGSFSKVSFVLLSITLFLYRRQKFLNLAYRRDFIRKMVVYGWNGYKRYAWGKNEVKPISLTYHSQGIFGGPSSTLGATIVDGLDTLILMKLDDEYNEVSSVFSFLCFF